MGKFVLKRLLALIPTILIIVFVEEDFVSFIPCSCIITPTATDCLSLGDIIVILHSVAERHKKTGALLYPSLTASSCTVFEPKPI